MYLSIIILPFLGSLVSGLMGRKIGVTGAHFITCTCLLLASLLATISFYEVGICGSPVSINLVSWVESEFMSISWEFLFDQLTVSMFIPVLYISSLIHIYSVDYLSSDPHNQRFFSYLSLFTFFMLLLASGANYFLMFVGWEGISQCLKWYNVNINLGEDCKGVQTAINLKFLLSFLIPIYPLGLGPTTSLPQSQRDTGVKLISSQRIGPHNIDIISIIIGSVLGETHLEKRQGGLGTRIIFEQSNKNVEYLMWFHNYFSSRGYCNPNKPKLHTRVKKNNKVFYHFRVNSYTFSSFNWIHDMFYKLDIESNKFLKIVPLNIEEYLTPLALAIWFMDDGSKLGSGVRIATNNFTLNEVQFLCNILHKKYKLIATVHSGGKDKGFVLYINKKSVPLFISLVKIYMHPSLYYKLGIAGK